jgi:DNA-binding NarL/FixJ family response regulator
LRADDAAGARLVGRERELDQLLALADGSVSAGQALLVLGEAGMGKTALVTRLTDRASEVGMRVLSTTGMESEVNLAFAGLHQLLRPLFAGLEALSERQRDALRGAFGLGADPAGTDRLLIGMAALTLLSDASEHGPALVLVEDAQWLDQSSIDALSFVANRVDAEQMVVVVTARGDVRGLGLDRSMPQLVLQPLSGASANELLDEQTPPPRGRARVQVLTQAAGNPLALIELTRVIASDPDAGHRWAVTPLPLSERLSNVFAAQVSSLPGATQAALVYAAVADGPDILGAIGSGSDHIDVNVLGPAEQLGLVRIGRFGLQFSHPLIRSAVYHAAPFAARAEAHRRLAEALRGQPDRHAWHLAAAAIAPDEGVASLLEATATHARLRDGYASAALAMERAAELSPSTEDRARRFISAALMAVPTGEADWVQDLASRALSSSADPELRIAARQAVGWSLIATNQLIAAVSLLLSVVEEALGRGLVSEAWIALGNAATAATFLGTAIAIGDVERGLELVEEHDQSSLDERQKEDADDQRMWIQATTNPLGNRSVVLPRLRNTTRLPLEVAGAAWAVDESELAVDLYQNELLRLKAPGARGNSGGALFALASSLYDLGRWDEALETAAEANDLALACRMDTIAALANSVRAMIHARRGQVENAREYASQSLANSDPGESLGASVVVRNALAVVALVDGSYLKAFTLLGQLFAADGVPLHNHDSYLSVADLALASVRADRLEEGRELLQQVFAHVGDPVSPRLQQLFWLARAVVGRPTDVEACFDEGLSVAGGIRWPFERAQLELAYAEWLRRRRRINEAKHLLIQATETFWHLHAEPSLQRAQAELRACGVVIEVEPDALAVLTPQQRQIVYLASEGLTNREIGDRLYLSPRTVGSHLYRCYPKLGVTARHQLRDLVSGR